MNLKKLTQAVFEGLPVEYRWAAVDANGKAWAFIKKPVCDDLMFCDGDDAKSENVGVFFDATDWQNSLIERRESITDVARSIESARVEERKHSHYFKDVSGVDAIDLYHVARLYDITDPALFHAFKKIACAGKRGVKDRAQDVQEAIDALKRWQELNA